MTSLMQKNCSWVKSSDFNTEMKHFITRLNYVFMIAQAIMSFSGILGNLLALIVINRRSLRHTSSAVFITYLAIFDSAVLLLHSAHLIHFRSSFYVHCSLIFLTELCTFCANWILVIITLERCIAVHSPFLARRFCTAQSARRSIYTLLSISILFFSITFPNIYHGGENATRMRCTIRARYKVAIRIYESILFYLIPDVLMLSNLFTVYALCQRHRQLSASNSKTQRNSESHIVDPHSHRRQRQLTMMLVTVSLSFYLFTTPAMIAFIYELFPNRARDICKAKRNFLISQLSVFLLQFNNATNFLFYCFAGQRFRQATRKTLNEYSTKMKTFYHRYILCNKNYQPKTNQQYQLTNSVHTTFSNRCSYSPNINRHRHRTSTL